MNITLILTGSIAAYKACALLSLLVKQGHTVQTVATPGALRFVGATSLEALSGRPVLHDLFAARDSMEHIELRRWSDLFLLYPATANRINQLAAGLAPDLLGALFLANNQTKPFWIAPAMNSAMLNHPATRQSLARLETWGCRILPWESGRLACGDEGGGRLLSPETTARLVSRLFRGEDLPEGGTGPENSRENEPSDALTRQGEGTPGAGRGPAPEKTWAGPGLVHQSVGTTGLSSPPPRSAPGADRTGRPQLGRVLVTGGAMRQPLDAVRWVENTSSGQTALTITRELESRGWQVDLLHYDRMDLSPGISGQTRSYADYQDFRRELEAMLDRRSYDWIIQAAAVADYHLEDPDSTGGKWESGQPRHLVLQPTEKILPRIKAMAHRAHPHEPLPGVVGFKLTQGEDIAQGAARAASMLENGADLVVWNDAGNLDSPVTGGKPESRGHGYGIFLGDSNAPRHQPVLQGTTTAQLARDLARLLEERSVKSREIQGADHESRTKE
ncbi:phosphopantothenoylcysteine decarboxylase domain-containing protein [Spirochaeta lutea]|uniref:phosphopantothenoylcysteine decarboxylase domain-containing protein n=1 Tax=Spirochaeta lutea TaxID=1480694 RepID=UPI0009DF3DA8|nr:flavoprotein [Spirochaeta lutea]